MSYLTKQNRQIAIGAARAELRDIGLLPERQTAQTALAALDDLARKSPETRASQWYENAPANQICLFVKDWEAWKRQYIRENYK